MLRGDDGGACVGNDGGMNRSWPVRATALAYLVAGLLALKESPYFGAPTALADPVAAGLVLLAAVLAWFLPRTAALSALVGGVIGYAVAAEPLLATSVAGLIGVIVLVRHRIPVLAVVPAVVLAIAAASWSRYGGLDTGAWLGELLVATAVTSAVAGATLARRSSGDAVLAEARLREQQITAERRDAILAERTRISRELHDVVAHSVSVIAVLAETAPFAVGGLPLAGKQRFAEIASSARGALGELRDLLSVLRRDDSAAPGLGTAPVPDLEGIERLIDEHRRAGRSIDLTTEGDLSGVPIAVEIAGHRIVQEALTNIRRHTDEAHTSVTLTRAVYGLVIRVRDTGPRSGTSTGSGHGLLGMQERAASLTGSLRAEPKGDGFEVTAELPIREGQL